MFPDPEVRMIPRISPYNSSVLFFLTFEPKYTRLVDSSHNKYSADKAVASILSDIFSLRLMTKKERAPPPQVRKITQREYYTLTGSKMIRLTDMNDIERLMRECPLPDGIRAGAVQHTLMPEIDRFQHGK